jgi:hypothetical protein
MSAPARVIHFTVAVAALLAGVRAQGKATLDRAQVIKDWGYSIQTIKGWNAIPVKPEEKFVAGHWRMNVDELRQRGLYEEWRAGEHCEVTIVRISNGAKTQENKDKDKEDPDKESKTHRVLVSPSMEKRLNPKSIDDYLEGAFEGADKRWTRKPLKGSKTPGEILEFGSGAEAMAVGVFRKDSVEWAVIYSAFEESYKKTWQDIYLKSIMSFTLIEGANTEVASAAHKDVSALKGDEKRDAIKASIAGNPGWYSIDSTHYVILSNSKIRPFVESLSKDLEIVREKVYTKLFPPRRGGDADKTATASKEESISPVRVLDTESEYFQYGGPGGSAGYFNPQSGELVLFTKFEDVTKTKSTEYCRSVMFHEGFHQYIHYAVGDVSPHSWFNEGHGDYFAGMTVPGGAVTYKTFSWRVQFFKEHKHIDLMPLRSLIRLPQREYYDNASLKYSEGWALIYYLRQVSRKKDEQQILDKYFTYLADNVEAFKAKKKEKDGDKPGGDSVPGIPGLHIVNFEDEEKVQKILSDAVDVAFKDIDIDSLERDLFAWIAKL